MLGVGQQIPPCIRQADGMTDPVKQLHAQFFFQEFDLKGYGRLGIPQLFSRAGEAAQLRRFQENVQAAQIHGTTPCFFIFFLL